MAQIGLLVGGRMYKSNYDGYLLYIMLSVVIKKLTNVVLYSTCIPELNLRGRDEVRGSKMVNYNVL